MKSWSEYFQLKENANKKICVILRGLPGAGKSSVVAELLQSMGGRYDGHVFSADNFYHPVSYKLQHMGHITPESFSLNEAIAHCQEIMDMWFKARYSRHKAEGESSFIEFKKLIDQGKYYEALSFAQQMNKILELVEYHSNWDAAKTGVAHRVTQGKFKDAVDQGITPVIVDNTNILASQAKFYAHYANDAGYTVRIEEPRSPHWQQYRDVLKTKDKKGVEEFATLLGTKNQHGVPVQTIKNMIDSWQPMTVDALLKLPKTKES